MKKNVCSRVVYVNGAIRQKCPYKTHILLKMYGNSAKKLDKSVLENGIVRWEEWWRLNLNASLRTTFHFDLHRYGTVLFKVFTFANEIGGIFGVCTAIWYIKWSKCVSYCPHAASPPSTFIRPFSNTRMKKRFRNVCAHRQIIVQEFPFSANGWQLFLTNMQTQNEKKRSERVLDRREEEEEKTQAHT